MRITAPNFWVSCLLLSVPALAGTAPETTYTRIAALASFLSQGDSAGALDSFDKTVRSFSAIERDIAALTAQAEVLCSIDIVEDKEADQPSAETHHLDLDWYMMLKSKTDPGLVERRRERIAVTVAKVQSKAGPIWRITELSPSKILAPITVH